MRKQTRKMRGGFLDSLTYSLSSWGNSLSNTFKKSTSYTPTTYTPTTKTYTPTTYTPTTYTPSNGGARRRRRVSKRFKGGFSANRSLNDVASGASSINVKTAQPQVWVGGKTRRHRHSRSCKH